MSPKRLLCMSLFFFAATSCQKSDPASTEPTAPPPVKKVVKKADKACVGPHVSGEVTEIKVGDTTWIRKGSTLKPKTPLERLVIGALTDIKEDAEENHQNLKRFLKWFAKEKANMIVVAGDTGMDKKQLISTLTLLASANVPVLNIIGNREGRGDYRGAMAELAKKHPNVFDLTQIRRVDTGFVDLVSMPGYFNPDYVHAEDGCQYFDGDVAELETILDTCDSPTLLVSHGGPMQQGQNAIDRTAEGENVGDPALTRLMRGKKVGFGIFGNIHEAGGRATDLEGKDVLMQGKAYDSMYLNPGPADGVLWVMNDGTKSVGMAGLMAFDANKKATYKIHRAPKPDEVAGK